MTEETLFDICESLFQRAEGIPKDKTVRFNIEGDEVTTYDGNETLFDTVIDRRVGRANVPVEYETRFYIGQSEDTYLIVLNLTDSINRGPKGISREYIGMVVDLEGSTVAALTDQSGHYFVQYKGVMGEIMSENLGQPTHENHDGNFSHSKNYNARLDVDQTRRVIDQLAYLIATRKQEVSSAPPLHPLYIPNA